MGLTTYYNITVIAVETSAQSVWSLASLYVTAKLTGVNNLLRRDWRLLMLWVRRR